MKESEPAWGPAVRGAFRESHASLFSVSGPYKYDGDLHVSFRIDSEDRIIASVYASDGDEDAAEALAKKFAAALAAPPVGGT